MSIRRDIIQTMTENWGCDICGLMTGVLVSYHTRTEVQRDQQDAALVNTWTETEWYVCQGCSGYVDIEGRASLMERATEQGGLAIGEAQTLIDDLLTPSSRAKQQPNLATP